MELYDKLKVVYQYYNTEEVQHILREVYTRLALGKAVGGADTILYVVPTMSYHAEMAVDRLLKEFPNGKYKRINYVFYTGDTRVHIVTPYMIKEGKIRGLNLKEVRWL